MDDLISRAELLKAYDAEHIGQPGRARKLIEDAPAIRIVRCKDCAHTEHCEIYAGWDGKHPNWFCADGEKRNVE